jgi:amino acid adenylation domain-containing protein
MKKEDIQHIYEASPLQKGIYFECLKNADIQMYVQQMNFELPVEIDQGVITLALEKLFERQEILRTVFIQKGNHELLQVVLKERKPKLVFVDVSENSRLEQDTKIETLQSEQNNESFNLSSDLLFRCAIVKRATNDYLWVLTNHHIIMDGWCIQLIQNELMHLYAAIAQDKEPNLPPVTQYRTYIKWLSSLDQEACLKQWNNYLNGFEQQTSLPKAKRGGSDSKLFQRKNNYFSDSIVANLDRVAKAQNVTTYSILKSAWSLLLAKYNQTTDVVFGSVVSGRTDKVEGIEHMIGVCINTIPVRTSLTSNLSVSELFTEMQMDYFKTSDLHYNNLSEVMDQSPLRNRLFNHILVYQNFTGINADSSKDEPETDRELLITQFDLTISIVPSRNLLVNYNYDAHMFAADQIDLVHRQFELILGQMLQNPEMKLADIAWVPADIQKDLVEIVNDTVSEYPETETVDAIWRKQVEETPDNIAIVDGSGAHTYAQIDESVRKMIGFLRENEDFNQAEFVGVDLYKNRYLIVAHLAIYSCGKAQISMDPDLPDSRKEFFKEDTGIGFTIDADVLDAFIAIESTMNLYVDVTIYTNTPESIAYVMYTSGSTGVPKGVVVTQQNIVSLVKNINYVSLNETTCLMSVSDIGFDAVVFEYWAPLLNGGRLILAPKSQIISLEYLSMLLEKYAINVVWATVSWLNQLIDIEPTLFKNVSCILFGGDKHSLKHLTKLNELYPAIEMIHCYGPTENTTFSTTHLIDFERDKDETWQFPIGKPLSNRTAYILTKDLQIAPNYMAAELYVGGVGLSEGYLKNEKLNTERFVENPFVDGEKLYKTGDMCFYNGFNEIVYVGRDDDQVKIRGYRIEIGEVEKCAEVIEGISQAIARVKKLENGDGVLGLYYTLTDANSDVDIRKQLRVYLPEYMIPSYFIKVDDFELTANGKINKKILPEFHVVEKENVPPSNKTEQVLFDIFKVVGGREFSMVENYQLSALNSLQSMTIMARINKAFSTKYPIELYYRTLTIRELAVGITTNSFEDVGYVMLGNKESKKNIITFPPGFGYGIAYLELADELSDFKLLNTNFLVEEDRIDRYFKMIKKEFADEPYIIFGYSSGGGLAYDFTKEAEKRGEPVLGVVILDTVPRSVEGEELVEYEKFIGEIMKKENEFEDPYLWNKSVERYVGYLNYFNTISYNTKLNIPLHLIKTPIIPHWLPINSYDSWNNLFEEFHMYNGFGEHFEMLFEGFVDKNGALINELFNLCQKSVKELI